MSRFEIPGNGLSVHGLRLEFVAGAVAFAALVFGIIGGLSPKDWTFWYAIPAAMIVLGLLLGKRAHLYSQCGRRIVSLLFAVSTALLIFTGTALALEHYAATPVDMDGHPL